MNTFGLYRKTNTFQLCQLLTRLRSTNNHITNTFGLGRCVNTFQIGQSLLDRLKTPNNEHVTNTFGLHRCVNTFGVLRCKKEVTPEILTKTPAVHISRTYESETNTGIQRRIKQDDGDIIEIISVLFKIGKL